LKENKDSLFCFTIPQSKAIAKIITHAQYSDSLVKVKEAEAQDLAETATRMQHNLDLQRSINEDYRKQISDKEVENVDCQKEKEVIIKSERKDKFRKAVVMALIGFCVGFIGHGVHF
jgi:phosphate starvation-inducible protein PhoH